MSICKKAIALSKRGFYIFPLIANKKLPVFKKFTERSTTDADKIKSFWFDPVLEIEQIHNVGIATSKYKDGALLVVDVDNKKGKNGSESIFDLELQGFEFPKTMMQKTPTGGLHLIYKVKTGVPNSVEKIGPGIDIRSRGGFIVGSGSEIDGKKYFINATPIANAPEWLIKKCNEEITTERQALSEPSNDINQKTALERAKDYLLNNAPLAVEGSGGDSTTFKVANKLKDFGLTKANALEALLDHWNDRCSPAWNMNDLKRKITNAYAYGQNKAGIDSPESDFQKIEKPKKKDSPIDKINEKFAFLILGGRSTIIHNDGDDTIFMNTQAFHDLLKPEVIYDGRGNTIQVSEAWFSSRKRRTYKALGMYPKQDAPPGVYNLWKGFSCEPLGDNEVATKEMIEGVRIFKEHALENVCDNDSDLFNWLMGYFAHLVQRPWEKPLTALVFKGKKGVGKNALIERVGNLITKHYLVTSSKRFVVHNFNKHMTDLLLFVLDEAFWSGDKQAEGILKDLITGTNHNIEHKGREVFSVHNLVRIVVIGNEDWIIPATEDERRFAVFNVGNARQKDKPYFRKMKKLIDEKDGNRLLLRELLDFDLKTVDVDDAPETQGLLDQKIESLDPVHSWWHSCLQEGVLLGQDFSNDWPMELTKAAIRDAYIYYSRQRGVRSWLPSSSAFGRTFLKCAPGITMTRRGGEGDRSRVYVIPTLEASRADFEEFINHKLDWEDGDFSDAGDIFS